MGMLVQAVISLIKVFNFWVFSYITDLPKKQAGGANIPIYLLQWSPQHSFNEQAKQVLFFNQRMFWLEIAKTRSIFVFLLKCSACFS